MGSISYTRLISMAQVLLLRTGVTVEVPLGLDNSVDVASASAFFSKPRLLLEIFPAHKLKGYAPPRIVPRHHYHHWVDACLQNGKTAAGFDYSGPLTEVILLGTVAVRCPDKELSWNAEQMKITNFPEANQYIRRSYRPSWTVPGL